MEEDSIQSGDMYSSNDSQLSSPDRNHFSRYQQSQSSGVQSRYSEAKSMRKQAEDDVQLLANRIALLKQEESKAWRRIEETKKKAREMMMVKQRNMENRKRKIELQRAREEEIESKQIHNKIIKRSNQDNKSNVREQLMQKLKEDVKQVKESRKENYDRILQMKNQDLLQKYSRMQTIKNQRKLAKQRRDMEEEEKREAVRIGVETKIEEEMRMKSELEEQIQRMEQEELDLISRIQNTQSLQMSVNNDLELILSGKIDPDSFAELKASISEY